jgi:hypothetical protein
MRTLAKLTDAEMSLVQKRADELAAKYHPVDVHHRGCVGQTAIPFDQSHFCQIPLCPNAVLTKLGSLHSASIWPSFRLCARSVALNLHPPPRQTFGQLPGTQQSERLACARTAITPGSDKLDRQQRETPDSSGGVKTLNQINSQPMNESKNDSLTFSAMKWIMQFAEPFLCYVIGVKVWNCGIRIVIATFIQH